MIFHADLDTYDVAWSTEFLEHVGRQYMRNYMPVFAKSALVFVTASGWGGWHHVEVHNQKWWIGRFEAMGFIFSREITDWIRQQARADLTASSAQTLAYGLMVNLMLIFFDTWSQTLPFVYCIIGVHQSFGGISSSPSAFVRWKRLL